jgi:general secretion pathway protein A
MTALEYYRLQEQPFGVTPDSRYLFLTETHKEALKSVLYGVESGCGFVALIATPGLGKTTLLFQTLDILRDNARIVFLFQTISTPLDLLRALLSGLGVRDLRGTLVEMQVMLKDLLAEQYSAGKKVVLVIDEAQNLDDSVLELVRMLSNFETARDKLIQIILAGQPQLAENIGSPELLQLRQRISIFARLKPFSPEETSQYIAYRLQIAGYASEMPLFTKDALALIALCSEGIPRNINNLCFNALSLGSALRQRPIDRDIIRQVVADLDIGPLRKKLSPPSQPEEISRVPSMFSTSNNSSVFAEWLPKVAVAMLALLAVGGALFAGRQWLAHPAAAPQPTAVASVPRTAIAPITPPAPAAMTSAPPRPVSPSTPPPTVSVQAPAAATVHPEPAPSAPPDPPASTQTITPATPAVTQTSALLGADGTPPSPDSVGVVRVAPGQTLLGICVEKFGTCTGELLRQIHELNPSLNDPDHIETGQNIRIPVLAAQASGIDQPRKSVSYDKSTHE